MLIVTKSLKNVSTLKLLLNKKFGIKNLGVAKKIFGIEIHKDKKARKFWVSQKKVHREGPTEIGHGQGQTSLYSVS